MAVLNVKKDEHFITNGTKMENIFWIMKGSVYQLSHEDEIKLESGSVIGLAECENGEYLCDYVAAEDCVFYTYSYHRPGDLQQIYETQPKYAAIFLLASLKTARQVLDRCDRNYRLAREYYQFCIEMYRQYRYLCTTYGVAEKPLKRIEYLKQPLFSGKITDWQVKYYHAFSQKPLAEVEGFYGGNDDFLNGVVLSAGHDIAQAVKLTDEIRDYLEYSRDLLLSEDGQDLFQLYYDLAVRASLVNTEIDSVQEKVKEIKVFLEKMDVYDEELLRERIREYDECDFATLDVDDLNMGDELGIESIGADFHLQENGSEEEGEDCLAHILSYAGYKEDEMEEIRSLVISYRELPDILATDDETRKLRRKLGSIFYQTYTMAFRRAVTEVEVSPILKMFFNFGFMDVSLAGEENANDLYDLTEKLFLCESEHVYTIFRWLKSIYEGKNEPSKNEFNLDYAAALREERKNGKITPEQEEALKYDNWNKTLFEIDNLFVSTNRATYGRISTFCPILAKHDLIGTPETMLMTAGRLEETIEKIKAVDYSVFYHDVIFSDPTHGINKELLKKEILPQIILMPNAGTRAMMWQETADNRRDTPARFIFPIFTRESVEDMMLETMARYRWEICRKIQGTRWNDVTEKSLTAEYCDYIQFYRKNRDLTAEAKEKIKNELFRAKNNYREVFVRDYINWIRFEASGSFRLNKVARNILFSYCPFSKKCRTGLQKNPMFTQMMERQAVLMEREAKRIRAVYEKYQKNGGELTEDLMENISYYEL